jgi:hypothetical protein
MHHHDKHAASKDGHRPDDPHGVTSNKWRDQQVEAMAAERHAGGIRREGHEVFDENVDYGQRVSAFGNVERNVSDEQGGGYDVQGDEMVDLTEGEEDQAFAKKAMLGQDYPPPPPPPPRQSNESEQAHIAANTQGFGPEETRWRADADEADRADASKWQRDRASDRTMEERTGRPSPPRPFPESRFTREGTGPGSPQRETKTPAPPRQDGLSHQRTPSDAAAVRAGPPPPPPKRKTPPPPPPPR